MGLRAVRPARRLAHGSPARARRGRSCASTQTRGIAVSLDGPRLGERDPFAAGYDAVFGAALNVACAGGEPLALTDCLNFGSPEKPEIAWELEQAIEGIAQAADELGIPVVSGNVSLYNETGGRSIPPTPVVGCVGLVRDVTARAGPLAGRRRHLSCSAAQARRSCASSGRTRTRSRSPTTSRTAAWRARCARPRAWSGRRSPRS